ncbi:hypothetical protein JCM6882_004868 [Rhodosporidiobolus microsporus]
MSKEIIKNTLTIARSVSVVRHPLKEWGAFDTIKNHLRLPSSHNVAILSWNPDGVVSIHSAHDWERTSHGAVLNLPTRLPGETSIVEKPQSAAVVNPGAVKSVTSAPTWTATEKGNGGAVEEPLKEKNLGKEGASAVLEAVAQLKQQEVKRESPQSSKTITFAIEHGGCYRFLHYRSSSPPTFRKVLNDAGMLFSHGSPYLVSVTDSGKVFELRTDADWTHYGWPTAVKHCVENDAKGEGAVDFWIFNLELPSMSPASQPTSPFTNLFKK